MKESLIWTWNIKHKSPKWEPEVRQRTVGKYQVTTKRANRKNIKTSLPISKYITPNVNPEKKKVDII